MNKLIKNSKSDLLMLLLKGRTIIVLVIMMVFFSIVSPNFLSVETLFLIAKHVALYGILGIGMTYVIITGGIDLSVGAIVGLSGIIVGGMINEGVVINALGYTLYFNIPFICVIAILTGALIGAINGYFITKFKVAPFIATLGMMYIARGLAMLRSNGATFSGLVGNAALGNTGFEIFGRNIGATPIPVSVVILIIIAIISAFILNRTPFGWHIKAIGGNERAAEISGIKINKEKIMVYLFSGACAAVVGIITASQLMAAHPASGESWEMNAIAAAVLGGTSMAGGIGTVGGTIIGAFVIGVINDGMVMCGVSEFWQMIIKGAVIVGAVIIDQFQRDLQTKMALKVRNNN
jgi:ribose/xylose/arabinose/galactoside ABC-type transport system permease subunit